MPKAVSKKQLKANKENSKLGGIKTEEGKEKSKLNALKHGICSDVLTQYEADMSSDLLNKLNDAFKPVGFLEETLVTRIAMYFVRLFRAGKAEKEFMQSLLDPEKRNNPFVALESEILNDGYKPQIKPEDIEKIQCTYMRYETGLENRLYKALHELERIQCKRMGRQMPSHTPIDINISKNGFVSQN